MKYISVGVVGPLVHSKMQIFKMHIFSLKRAIITVSMVFFVPLIEGVFGPSKLP